MARYYTKKSQEIQEDTKPKAKEKSKEKSEIAEMIRKSMEEQRIPNSIKKLHEWLNFYARQSFIKPGISKDYFESTWCNNFWTLVKTAYPKMNINKLQKYRPIDAINYVFRSQAIPYRIIWMNEMYSTNMYFYIFKIGKFI